MHHWAEAGARWWGWGIFVAPGLTKDPLYCPLPPPSSASLVSGCPITLDPGSWISVETITLPTPFMEKASQEAFLESLGLGKHIYQPENEQVWPP